MDKLSSSSFGTIEGLSKEDIVSDLFNDSDECILLESVPPRTLTKLPIATAKPEWEDGEVFIAFPCYKTTNPATAWCLIAMAKDFGSKVRLDMSIGDAMIYHSRNTLAHRFLQSNAKWLLFIDDDMIVPIGRPNFLREMCRLSDEYPSHILGLNTIERLLSHRKSVVGASYFSRHVKGRAVNGLASDSNYFSKARSFHDGILEAPWIGTGCMLVTREVFEDMKKKFPSLAPVSETMPWNFFHPGEDGRGEDVAFCGRAKECGHPVYVDTMLHAFHVGYGTYGVHTSILYRD